MKFLRVLALCAMFPFVLLVATVRLSVIFIIGTVVMFMTPFVFFFELFAWIGYSYRKTLKKIKNPDLNFKFADEDFNCFSTTRLFVVDYMRWLKDDFFYILRGILP